MKFLDSLLKARGAGRQIVIPDIKAFSPKEGELLRGREPVEYARLLIEAGAPALSVVTEEKEFHGSLEMLKKITDEAGKYGIPVLRKDFIHDESDLLETRECGASAILLMCSCLEREELKDLYHKSLELGLDPFVETHEIQDLELVEELKAELVGINNRDIRVLEKDDGDIRGRLDMIASAPKSAFLVSESSISSPGEVRMALEHGADAVLVGTAILRAENTVSFYRMMSAKVDLKICGLMREEDIRCCLDAGVPRIGFVVEYPVDVPWNLDRGNAKALMGLIPAGFEKVIVTGGSRTHIMEVSQDLRPDAVQLHYRENNEDTKFMASELKKMGIETIKTLPVKREDCVEQFGTEDIAEIVGMLNCTDISEILIDPRQGEAVGKKDLKADEKLFRRVKDLTKKRVMLAGGLNSGNLDRILKCTGAGSVDIMTGCEIGPGKKDECEIMKLAEIVFKQ